MRGTVTLAIRVAALEAWDRLQQALRSSETVPCAGRDEWCSDDPEQRAAAATACQGCPALAQCNAFAEANGETFGVWGGFDRSARDPGRRGGGRDFRNDAGCSFNSDF